MAIDNLPVSSIPDFSRFLEWNVQHRAYRIYSINCPGARFSNVPVTLQDRNQIFKSKYKE